MLSRVADSLYWMSRYMERSDGILRMLKIHYASSQDDIETFTWKPVLQVFSYLDTEEVQEMEKDTQTVLAYFLLDKDNHNSVLNMVTKARENARTVQDHITKELWQCLNEFYHSIRDEHFVDVIKHDPITVLDSFIKHGLLYYGIADITMSRGEGLFFMNIGKYLERSIQSVDALNVKFNELSYNFQEAVDTTSWQYFLLSLSGLELYLKSYRSGFEAKNIVDQILFNVKFPRSVQYCLNQLQRSFDRVKSEQSTESFDKVNFQIGKLRSKVQYSTIKTISETGLEQYLYEIHRELNGIGAALNQYYFAY